MLQAGVSFWTAWAIPGVAAFSLTLFFAKLVAYTFLYWLPYYINATDVGGRKLTPTVSSASGCLQPLLG